ncbi:MAG: hypothetical protein V7642_2463 [Burkholderiales bacterium]|jgi:hypothetical protein
MKSLVSATLVLALAACALPETAVKTGSPRPHLIVKGAPSDSTLVVDGLPMGAASQYDGKPNVLIVEEGVHQIEIRRGDIAVHAEKTFISNGETRTVTVNLGAK